MSLRTYCKTGMCILFMVIEPRNNIKYICKNVDHQLLVKQKITIEISSGTTKVHTIVLSTGFEVMRYESPFSANLVSRCPKLRKEKTSLGT